MFTGNSLENACKRIVLRLIATIRKPAAILLMLPFTFSCGAVVEKRVRSYEIYIDTKSASKGAKDADVSAQNISDAEKIEPVVKSFIEDLNRKVGFEVLKVVSQPGKGISEFSFYTALTQPAGHETAIGTCGNREEIVSETEEYKFGKGMVKEIVLKTYMECSFQIDYFLANLKNLSDPLSANYEVTFHTFVHETGHGLGMAHVNDRKDVMYPWVLDANRPDYARMYERIRQIFNIKTNSPASLFSVENQWTSENACPRGQVLGLGDSSSCKDTMTLKED